MSKKTLCNAVLKKIIFEPHSKERSPMKIFLAYVTMSLLYSLK